MRCTGRPRSSASTCPAAPTPRASRRSDLAGVRWPSAGHRTPASGRHRPTVNSRRRKYDTLLDVNVFDELRIGLATAEDIRAWSHGEVKKPETINYRTLKPEKDGLFCEKIFGPTRDWECYCGKYKRVRFKGIICERCGVEVTRSKVRRERMGHIELAAPVTHIWFFKGVPSRLGYLLDLAPKDLEKVIYFAAYMITEVDEEGRTEDLPNLRNEIDLEKNEIGNRRDVNIDARARKLEEDLAQLEAEGAKADARRKVRDSAEREMAQIRKRADAEIERLEQVWDRFTNLKVADLEGDESLYRQLVDRYGPYFKGAMGAAAIQKRLQSFDLDAEAVSLRDTIKNGKGQRKTRALKRLKVVNAFLTTSNSPEAMVLDAVPVIPPDLRPMVQLDGGRFATSDLNDLYRRVINRNNRLKRLLDLGAPEIIVNNEKRMLQEAVDALFDNGRRGRPVTGPGNRPLKSISDMLKGKQGRFRQNLLGKRVDYSGRSVIVVGPELKLHQCGLPKQMALELFKPFVMKRLVNEGHAHNIKSAKRMVERVRPQVWDVLEEVISDHPVLLNRAPTLHRLGIQAFEPILVEGRALQIHPLVCTAYNADFDGDQMAVHVPLSTEAQTKARLLMLASHNILNPKDGRPVQTPTQDMVLGSYYLTMDRPGAFGEGKIFKDYDEAVLAYDSKAVHLQASIKVRRDGVLLETTVGRLIFNSVIPPEVGYFNEVIGKKGLGDIIAIAFRRCGYEATAILLDGLKNQGFKFSTRAGITVGLMDITIPEEKTEILAKADAAVAKTEQQYRRGLITDEERYNLVIDTWAKATKTVTQALMDTLDQFNPVYMMATSGARGNIQQLRQLAGMRGLMADPTGKTIELPIKANFREGLTVLEYFISSHGARKGLADTALRTADSGYLTRRLVDVSQDVIVREDDCETLTGIMVEDIKDGPEIIEALIDRLVGRFVLEEIHHPKTGELLASPDYEITEEQAEEIVKNFDSAIIRSVLTCKSRYGVCKKCYGRNLAT